MRLTLSQIEKAISSAGMKVVASIPRICSTCSKDLSQLKHIICWIGVVECARSFCDDTCSTNYDPTNDPVPFPESDKGQGN